MTYSKVYIFVLLAVIGMLTGCQPEPTFTGEVDCFQMRYANDYSYFISMNNNELTTIQKPEGSKIQYLTDMYVHNGKTYYTGRFFDNSGNTFAGLMVDGEIININPKTPHTPNTTATAKGVFFIEYQNDLYSLVIGEYYDITLPDDSPSKGYDIYLSKNGRSAEYIGTLPSGLCFYNARFLDGDLYFFGNNDNIASFAVPSENFQTWATDKSQAGVLCDGCYRNHSFLFVGTLVQQAIYIQNDTVHKLPPQGEPSQAVCILEDGDDIYIGGSYQWRPAIWKNYELYYVFDSAMISSGNGDSHIVDMKLINNNFYVSTTGIQTQGTVSDCKSVFYRLTLNEKLQISDCKLVYDTYELMKSEYNEETGMHIDWRQQNSSDIGVSQWNTLLSRPRISLRYK